MKIEYTESQMELANFAKAMGHPTRIFILQYLASLDSCFFGDIHKELGISKATISEHLRILKDSGFIQGEILPPKVKYCVNREKWQKASVLFNDVFSSLNKKKSCCK